MGFFSNLFLQEGLGKAIDPFELTSLGKDSTSHLEGLVIPEFQEDPDYRETQDILKKLGTDILAGDIPEHLKPLTETGSPQFEKYLDLLKGDVASSVESAAAATGRRGGVVQSVTAEKVGRLSTEARYQDYERALQGTENMFNTGVNITSDVRQAGQNQQGQVNAFSLDKYDREFGLASALDSRDAAEGAAEGKLLSSMATVAGGVGGFLLGGTAEAQIGASAAGALTGGAFDFSLLDPARKAPTVGTTEDKKIKIGAIDPYKSIRGSVK